MVTSSSAARSSRSAIEVLLGRHSEHAPHRSFQLVRAQPGSGGEIGHPQLFEVVSGGDVERGAKCFAERAAPRPEAGLCRHGDDHILLTLVPVQDTGAQEPFAPSVDIGDRLQLVPARTTGKQQRLILGAVGRGEIGRKEVIDGLADEFGTIRAAHPANEGVVHLEVAAVGALDEQQHVG